MSRFKIGQRVVCIDSIPTKYLKKGATYVINGFYACPDCGVLCVKLECFTNPVNSECLSCGHTSITDRPIYRESRFAPLSNIADAVEYRLSVSIPELTKIKEHQLS